MTEAATPGRIQAARLRAQSAKLTLAVAVVAAFLVLLVLVRASHPAKSSAAAAAAGSSAPSSVPARGSFSQGSIAPSQSSAPTISSGGS